MAVSVFWCLKRVHIKERKRGDKKAGALHSTMVDRRLENAIWSQPKQPFMSFIVIVYLKCQMTNKSCYNFSMIETQKFVWVNPNYWSWQCKLHTICHFRNIMLHLQCKPYSERVIIVQFWVKWVNHFQNNSEPNWICLHLEHS